MLKTISLLSFLLFICTAFAQEPPCKSYNYWEAIVTISSDSTNKDLCNKVLNVYNGDILLFTAKADELSSSTDGGLLVPDEHFVRGYFLVIKQGNNKGNIFLIDRRGNVSVLPGNKYFIYKPLGLLFTKQNNRFAVFDFALGKTLYDSGLNGGTDELYAGITFYSFNQTIYIKAESDPALGKDYSREALYKYNFEKNSIEKITYSGGLRLNEIPLAPDVVEKEGCSCN